MKKKMASTLIMSWEWNIASLYFLGWACRQSAFYPVGWRLELLGVCCEHSHSVEICPKQEIGRHFMRHDLIVWDPYKTGRVQPLPSNETEYAKKNIFPSSLYFLLSLCALKKEFIKDE